jgi:flavorubredoxin
LAALNGKQLVGVYDAFGGDDEPIDSVAGQLRSQGQKEAFSPLRIRQLPQGGDYQRCEE